LDAEGHPLAGTVVLPIVHGLTAFSRGDYAQSTERLEFVLDDLPRIGGSNQQRDVFEETLLEAYARSGARQRLEDRIRSRIERGFWAWADYWITRLKTPAQAS
jgi:hypothetical protein